MAAQALREGRLHRVADVPFVAFSPYICWRASLEGKFVHDLIALAKRHGDRNRIEAP
jgi:hypothetical protein